MRNRRSGATVVVGIDGSKTATDAARWAVDVALSRDIPLRLAYVIDPLDSCDGGAHERRLTAACTALLGGPPW